MSVILLSLLTCVALVNGSKSSSSSSEEAEEYAMQSVCAGYYDDWDPIDTPLEERDFRGRIRHINNDSRIRALNHVKSGELFDLAYVYNNSATSFKGDSFETVLYPILLEGAKFLFQSLQTLGHGNLGTQFDHFCHVSLYDESLGKDTDLSSYVMYNNARESELRSDGTNYYGFDAGYCIDLIGPIVSTVHLIDAAGYVGVDRLESGFEIGTQLFDEILDYQGMSMDDIEAGDVVIFYTGIGLLFGTDDFYGDGSPGINLELVKDRFYDTGVAILGGDGWAIEAAPSIFPVHRFWLVCAGGFFNEALNLHEWVMAARQDHRKFTGAYFFNPNSIEGAPCSMGDSYVMV